MTLGDPLQVLPEAEVVSWTQRALCEVLSEEKAEVVSWMQRALCEERREVERLLARRHEDIVWRLQRMPLTVPVQPKGQPTQQSRTCRDVELLPPELSALAPGLEAPPLNERQHSSDSTVSLSAIVVVEEAQPCDASPSQQCEKSNASSDEGQRASAGKPPGGKQAGLQHSAIAASQWGGKKDSTMCAKVHEQACTLDSDLETSKPLVDTLRIQDHLSHMLDLSSGVVVSLFIVLMAVWMEYSSYDLAVLLVEAEGFEDSRPGTVMWPHADTVFHVLEWGFGLFFCLELAMRIAFRIRLWPDIGWNTMDALIVTAFWIEKFGASYLSQFNPGVLRLARFFRLLRLLKLIRHVHSFDSLLFITKAINSSMQVLSWTVALLGLLMMIVAMVIGSLLEGYIKDDTQDLEARMEIFKRWGSFVRAFVSMFEITLANWGPQCWLLMNQVNEIWGFFFIAWRCCVGFAVIQVITSVFIQHTFKVANRDEDVMIQEKQKASECYLRHLDRLFTTLDESGDGQICRQEFEVALAEPRVKHWFGALEIDVSDVPKLFHMLDDGDGQISKDEFIVGLKKLKGPAQSVDMVQVVKDCRRIRAALGDTIVERHNTYFRLISPERADAVAPPMAGQPAGGRPRAGTARV